MANETANRISTAGIVAFSLIGLLAVLFGTLPVMAGQAAPPTDEGIAAHVFQLSIAALLLMSLVFLATVDWKQPLRVVRRLGLPVTALVLALGTLSYYERVYLPEHGHPFRPGLPARVLHQIFSAM
jgi:DMSO/TMAO reductase YedYZ heme-binding membrane subunit